MTRSYAPLGGIWKGFAPEAAPVSGEQDRAAQAPGRHRRRWGHFDGRLGHPSGEGRMAAAGAAARRYARMFPARALAFTVPTPARPARRPAVAGKPAVARRLAHWLGRRRAR